MVRKPEIANSLMRNAFPIAVTSVAIFISTYVLAGLLYTNIAPQSDEFVGTVSRWCERITNSIFLEPINSLSNLGFIIVGLSIIKTLSYDSLKPNPNRMNQFNGINRISILYPVSALCLGAGSMMMHGTNSNLGGWADNLGMVMYILIPWLINIKEMGRWSTRKFLIVYASILIIYAFGRWFGGKTLGINLDLFNLSIGLWPISEILFRFWSVKLRWLSGFVGFIVAAVFGIMPYEIFTNIEEYWWVILFWLPAILSQNPPDKRRSYMPWAFIGTAIFIGAYAIWLQGTPGTPFCNPDSLMQLHGIWHLMTAFSIWCFFKFLRTERNLLGTIA